MTKVLHFALKEVAFFNFQRDAGLRERCEDIVHVRDMVFYGLRKNYDVVNIDQTGLPLILRNYKVEGALETRWCVCET